MCIYNDWWQTDFWTQKVNFPSGPGFRTYEGEMAVEWLKWTECFSAFDLISEVTKNKSGLSFLSGNVFHCNGVLCNLPQGFPVRCKANADADFSSEHHRLWDSFHEVIWGF